MGGKTGKTTIVIAKLKPNLNVIGTERWLKNGAVANTPKILVKGKKNAAIRS
jgi:hypothetical protein